MLFVKAPLHVLRKTKAFQSLLMSRFNNPKLYDLGYNHQVALKPFTHASIRWRKQQLEPGISKLVKNIAKELDLQNDRGCFFDVGANVGLYIWEVSKICPHRKILAFEPDPENIKLLEQTLSGANLQNLEICKCALSNQDGEISFFQDKLTSATGCVEGQEMNILEGAKNLFDKSKIKAVFIDGFYEPKIISFLKDYHFKLLNAQSLEESSQVGGQLLALRKN
jgi:hypothetical protein